MFIFCIKIIVLLFKMGSNYVNMNYVNVNIFKQYRKVPCISRTFSSKLKSKIGSAAYLGKHLWLEFLKAQLIFIKTS